jgi:hypothetical protein
MQRFGSSKLSLLLIAVSFIGPRLAAVAGEVPPRENPERVIQYLVDFVTQSDWTFIRNGKEYTGRQAAAHMTKKYKHFKERIQSPEDFIRLAASKSLVSGRAYLVRSREGKELRSEEWLLEALNDYRKAKSAQKPGSEDS